MKLNSNKLICAVALMAIGFSASASTFYNDTSLYNANLLQLGDGVQVGNEVSLQGKWSLTNFSFEYYSPDLALNSSLNVDVRFYLNNGTITNGHPTPGTLIYDSGLFYNTALGNLPTGSHTVNYFSADLYSGPGINLPAGFILPSDFTFTITFNNFSTNSMYLPLANNTTGFATGPQYVTSFGDYWLYRNGSWTLLEATGNTPANFLVNMAGVPEPSVFYLGAVGSAILLGASKLKRKR